MSTFSGLNTGLSSLYASRRALELTGQNITNVNTEGYSRQRLDLKAVGGPTTPAIHSKYDGVGGGVMVAGVDRLRDMFLESRALTERGKAAELAGDRVLLGRIEAVMAEPGEFGIQRQLADFWDGWDDVANQPDSLAARSQVLERASTLAEGLNGAVRRLDAQADASRQQLTATVLDINAVAAGVADFNRAIVSATQAGLSPNDLLDKRDVLVQRLGELAGVTIKHGKAGSVDVSVDGQELVVGPKANMLQVQQQTQADGSPKIAVGWGDPAIEDGDGAVVAVGGAAGSLLDGLTEVLPRYRTELTTIAAKVLKQVNDVHTAAHDLAGAQGMAFFELVDGQITVNEALKPENVAASTTYVPAAGGQPARGDRGGAAAASLAELANAKGGPDELYRRTIVTLGVEAQAAGRRVETQDNILGQIDAARESQSGVSLDEEMTNMLAFQKAYESAARFVSAVDQMLDTLINRTGIVGR